MPQRDNSDPCPGLENRNDGQMRYEFGLFIPMKDLKFIREVKYQLKI